MIEKVEGDADLETIIKYYHKKAKHFKQIRLMDVYILSFRMS